MIYKNIISNILILTKLKGGKKMMNKILGIIGIILGIILIVCPLAGFLAYSLIAAISLIFLGIFVLAAGCAGHSKIANIILGLIILILGLVILFYPPAAAMLASLLVYIIGLLIIIVSIVNIFTGEGDMKFVSIVGIIMGILYILIGMLLSSAAGPFILGILIGIILIVSGAKALTTTA